MRTLLHLLSVALALPCLALAAAFFVLGRAIAAQSLPGFFGILLERPHGYCRGECLSAWLHWPCF